MKKILSMSFALAGVASVAVISLTAPVHAEKKCKDGYVWDISEKKCVKETRGSY